MDLLVQFEPDKKSFDNFMHLSVLLEELLQEVNGEADRDRRQRLSASERGSEP